ncbi:MAG: hypothetical protein AAGA55_11410 [Planctomycetota bacterium]
MSDEMVIRLVLHGGVIPGAASLMLLGVLWWVHARKAALPSDESEPKRRGPRWILPVLLAGGFIAADHVVKVRFEWWPRDNTMRVAHAAALLGLFGAVEGLVRLPAWGATLGRAAVFGLLAWMLCEGYAPNAISTPDLWGIVAASAAIGSLIAHAADRGSEGSPGWQGALAWIALIAALQPMFHLARFSSGSMAMAGVVAVLTSTLIVSVFVKDLRLSGGGVTVLVGLLLAGVLGAGVQNEPESVPALLLMGGLPLVFVLAAGGPKRTLLVRGIAIVLIAGTIGALLHFGAAGGGGTDEADPYADYYG